MPENNEFKQSVASIINIIQTHLAETSCEVYLFGSWANGTAGLGSDIDIAIDSPADDLSTHLAFVRDALEESTIPYKVDLIDLQQSSALFIEQAMSEGQLLWAN